MGAPRLNLLPLPSSPSLTPFLFSPAPTSVSITVATLRLHATYIRDTLFPLLHPNAPYLPSQEFYLLTTILARVFSTRPITTDLLRQSRIVKALQLITSTPSPGEGKPDQGRWPPDSIIQARKILRHWERELGDIYHLRTNLFASGAPLAGIHLAKLYKTTKKSVIVRDEILDILWTLEHRPDAKQALTTGHMHLTVGDRWLNLAALYRDCGIGDPCQGFMTWDEDRAYALVLGAALEQDEVAPSRLNVFHSPAISKSNMWKVFAWKQASEYDSGSTVKVRFAKSDRGVFKLMRTMAGSDQTKNVIRIFRHVRWGGKYAPKGGVRYDGLYRPVAYSVHLSPPSGWKYIFALERELSQPSLTSVLHVPISEQMDDWEDFLAMEDGRQETAELMSRERPAHVPPNGERIRDLVKSKTAMSQFIEAAKEQDMKIDSSQTVPNSPAVDTKWEAETDSGYFSLSAPLS